VATIYPRVIGAADASGDGRPEVFVKLSAILYHVGGEQIEGIFGIVDGHLTLRQVAVHSDLEPPSLHITDPPIEPYYRLECGQVHA
jgi:hypothetical protein